MFLYEIKVRCGKDFDVVSPQVTLNLCLKIELLQAQLAEAREYVDSINVNIGRIGDIKNDLKAILDNSNESIHY